MLLFFLLTISKIFSRGILTILFVKYFYAKKVLTWRCFLICYYSNIYIFFIYYLEQIRMFACWFWMRKDWAEMNRWNHRNGAWVDAHCFFVTTSDFWRRLETSNRTILGWVFVKCFFFLKPHCKKIERWIWLSRGCFLLLQILIEPCS